MSTSARALHISKDGVLLILTLKEAAIVIGALRARSDDPATGKREADRAWLIMQQLDQAR